MKKSAKIISFALAMALVFGMTLNVSQSPVAKAAETKRKAANWQTPY